MRRFVIVGQKARASPDFLLVDIPSTSGRLDVLLHALRAGLLFSHGVRTDTVVYLVLAGPPDAPRTVRIEGGASRYLRPDERSLATTLKKLLAWPCQGAGFEPVRAGMAVALGGIETVLAELGDEAVYVLEQAAPDVRAAAIGSDATFVLGDHVGLPEPVRARLVAAGASALSVGPRALHSADVIALVHNELDRRELGR
jgi:tRNA (pseudouridine54-N1)-methyltransferase